MAGRPRNSEPKENPAKLALLNAASAYLAEKPSAAISIRAIADYAGVNSALISYYFGGKEGLLSALIDAAAKPLLTLDLATLKMLPAEQRTKIVIGRFIAINHGHRWLPRLLIDDLVSDPGSLQDHFVKQVGSRLAKLLQGFAKLQQDDGYFRADLDTKQTAVSLLSLLAFPFLAVPLLEQSHQLKAAQLGNEKWINHLCALFENGCRA